MPLKCSNNAQWFCLTKMLEKMLAQCTKAYLLIIEASRDPALLPKERNMEVSMELDEQEPEEQAKQVSRGDTEEQNKKWMSYFGCSIVRHYLPFGKTCLTFVIFFIKILKAKKIKQHFSIRSISFCGTIDHLIEDNRLILIIFKNCRWLVDSFTCLFC